MVIISGKKKKLCQVTFLQKGKTVFTNQDTLLLTPGAKQEGHKSQWPNRCLRINTTFH